MEFPERAVAESAPHLAQIRSLRVAVVDEEAPYPLNSGKRIRTSKLLLQLAQRHCITYICNRNRSRREAGEAAAFLADHGIATVFANRRAPRSSVNSSPLRLYPRLLGNLLSPLPYSVAANCGAELRRVVDAYARANPVDLWHCEWTPCAQALRRLNGAPVLVMAHNVESLIWQRYHETETNWLRRLYIRLQWRKFERFERRIFADATRTVTVSDTDAALARDRYGATRIAVVANGVDTAHFRLSAAARDPAHLLFLGSLDWRPNLDGVRLLLDQFFPAIQAEVPQARLSIVGRKPPSWLLTRAAEMSNVDVVAGAADVRPFLDRCGVMVVPLRIGGGTRIKILEALASGMPVVSTPVGAEGLCVEHGKHLVVADVAQMVPALVDCIRCPERVQAFARAGRRLVEAEYDWHTLADQLERIWFDCVAAGSQTVGGGSRNLEMAR
jgi:polysaccharide biosynthesis protein PslH